MMNLLRVRIYFEYEFTSSMFIYFDDEFTSSTNLLRVRIYFEYEFTSMMNLLRVCLFKKYCFF